jgi:hypothetical protein
LNGSGECQLGSDFVCVRASFLQGDKDQKLSLRALNDVLTLDGPKIERVFGEREKKLKFKCHEVDLGLT